jgi:uncharacterized protein YukE
MVKIMAICNDLDNYGKLFETKSEEFNQITKKMESIVSALDSGWTGIDADNFRANATAYLANLKRVEASMASYGNTVRKKSNGYSNACASFYDILNR